MKQDDYWLEKWKKEIIDKEVLEIGCGEGRDTSQIVKVARKVTACDIDIARAKTQLPSSETLTLKRLDHSKPLDFINEYFDIIIASLTLHYFRWDQSKRILSELKRVLKRDGFLICRLNSTNDLNHGVTGYEKIENGLYSVKGRQKRFFDESMILDLFNDSWVISHLEEKTIDRYDLPKSIWEFTAKPSLNQETNE